MTEITKPCANFCKYKYSLMFYLLASLFMVAVYYNSASIKRQKINFIVSDDRVLVVVIMSSFDVEVDIKHLQTLNMTKYLISKVSTLSIIKVSSPTKQSTV